MTQPRQVEEMSEADFGRIADIARKDAGIELPPSKMAMIQSRVFRHMRRSGFDHGLSRYIDTILSDAERRHELVSVLTTNVTGFFREPHHFETLRTWLAGRSLGKSDRVRIWSAGCSGGHEPYSIAMTCHQVWGDLEKRDLRILATDIDRDILNRARGGNFTEAEVEKIAPADLARFFRRDETADTATFRVTPALQAPISFKPLNLHDRWPMSGPFDAIFCRNVVIYFSDDGRAALWPRFRDILAPGGLLFIGHSERIHPLQGSGFESAGVTTFRKVVP